MLCAISLTGCGLPPAQLAKAVHEQFAPHSLTTDADSVGRDGVVLQWAADEGLEVPATIEEATRPSGNFSDDPWQGYRERLRRITQALHDRLRRTITEEDARRFYEDHPERFQRQDTIAAVITYWENNRAVATATLEITEHNVRMLQEGHDRLIAATLALDTDERSVVELEPSRVAEVRCVSRIDGGLLPFQEVMDAAAAQLVEERFDDEVRSRLG